MDFGHRLVGLGERVADADDEAEQAGNEAARAAARVGVGFDQMARIDELRRPAGRKTSP